MDLSRLQELKHKLINDKELSGVWTFFLDHFGDHDEFMALGKQASHPFVEELIAEIGKQVYGRDGSVTHMLLARIASQNFIHGGFGLGRRMGGLIFFEDDNVGLLALTEMPPATGARYVRFTPKPFPKSVGPSLN
jgi:hypothetical protein